MLSREANSIYWLGRYLERAENLCRFIYVNLHYMLDLDLGDYDSWLPLVRATGDEKSFFEKYKKSNENNVMKFLTFDQSNPNSMINCVKAARENARSIRSVLSSGMWEQINLLYWHTIEHSKKKSIKANREAFYSEFQTLYLRFLGSFYSSMTRSEPWHFLKSGILIERADKTGRILDVKYFASENYRAKLGNIYDSVMWKALLKSVSALEMFRKEYAKIDSPNVTEFLIANPAFPRSMIYCLQEARFSLLQIAKESHHPGGKGLLSKVDELIETIEADHGNTWRDLGVHPFVDIFQTSLNHIDNDIFELFFKLKENEEGSYQGMRQIQIQ